MDPEIAAVRSPQLPVLSPDVVDLVQMIDDNKSYNAIFHQLCNSSLVTNCVPNDLNTDTNRILLHSLPPLLLRSLLMGTLGSHLYHKDAKRDNWNNVYDDAYPGAYAALLCIHHRKGAFISQRETRQLIAALEKYALGVKLYDQHYRQGVRIWPTSDREALEFTQVIDDELRQVTHWDPLHPDRHNRIERPRFAKSETQKIGTVSAAHSNIETLISMFKSRCTVDESDLDCPDLDVYQLQSPMMIGNTGYMRGRLVNHLVDDQGSGTSTAKVYALTKSCLTHMGLEVKSVALPILVTWEEDQIDPAEVLLTVLANSRLPGHGYNLKTPGTRGSRTPNPRFEPAREHVFYWRPFFKSNLQRSLDELRDEAVAEERAELTKVRAKIRSLIDDLKSIDDNIIEAETGLIRTNERVKEITDQTAAKVAEIDDANLEMKEFEKDYKEHMDFWKGI